MGMMHGHGLQSAVFAWEQGVLPVCCQPAEAAGNVYVARVVTITFASHEAKQWVTGAAAVVEHSAAGMLKRSVLAGAC